MIKRKQRKPVKRVQSNTKVSITKAVRKKILKANKVKINKALKRSKERIDKVLKDNKKRVIRQMQENNARVTSLLNQNKPRRHKPAKQATVYENPFEKLYFGKTFAQRLKRVSGEIYSIRDQILYGIASGHFKFVWNSVAKEVGLKTGERKKMLSILSNSGYTVEQLAHHIWEDNDGKGNTQHIRNEIIDVLSRVSSRGDALVELEKHIACVPF